MKPGNIQTKPWKYKLVELRQETMYLRGIYEQDA